MVKTMAICAERWYHPERCTMVVIDAVDSFLLAKVLTAAMVSFGALLICHFAKAEPGAGVWARRFPIWILKVSLQAETSPGLADLKIGTNRTGCS